MADRDQAYLFLILNVEGIMPVVQGAAIVSDPTPTISNRQRWLLIQGMHGSDYVEAREALIGAIADNPYYKWLQPLLGVGRSATGVPMWQTKTGELVPYSMLSDDHLLNIERGLREGTCGGNDDERQRITSEVARRGIKAFEERPPVDAQAITHLTSARNIWHATGDPQSVMKEVAALVERAAQVSGDDDEHLAIAVDHLQTWSSK